MKIRKLATALIFGLVSSVALADGVPVMINGGGLHYSDLDRQITDRVIAVASTNPMYSVVPSAPVADQAQCILDAGTILQTAFNNYLEKTLKRTGKTS